MECEFVEFYPIKNAKVDGLQGTVHVFIIDFKMDLRGIHVYRNKNNVIFRLPCLKSKDKPEEKGFKFPVIDFPDKKITKDLINAIIKVSKEEVQRFLGIVPQKMKPFSRQKPKGQ